MVSIACKVYSTAVFDGQGSIYCASYSAYKNEHNTSAGYNVNSPVAMLTGRDAIYGKLYNEFIGFRVYVWSGMLTIIIEVAVFWTCHVQPFEIIALFSIWRCCPFSN